MRIKNLELVLAQIRPKLSDYLKEHGRDLSQTHFQCPNSSMHNNEDRNPSCCFYPDEEHFHCFTCNAAGDIFKAASLIEGRPSFGIEFITENVIYLAKKYNIRYEEEEGAGESGKSDIYDILELISKLACNTLKKDSPLTKEARDYINRRNWDELVDVFEFGWCKYDKLLKKLGERATDDNLLTRAGILPSKTQKKKSFQKYLFDDRIIFPIRNHFGRVIAFASRDYKGKKGTIRYVNFNTTEAYQKSNVLFNLDKARFQSSKVYVVEGYADVFTMYLYGIKNVVALCGKNFTDSQYELLVKCGVKRIVFCLDNEEGAYDSLDSILHKTIGTKNELDISIKKLDKTKDPDEYLLTYGPQEFLELPELSIFEYQLQKYLADQSNDVHKNECLNAIIREDSPITRERMIKKMSSEAHISTESIQREIHGFETDSASDFYQVTMSDILAEQEKMEAVIGAFEKWAWSREELLGLHMGWPILTEKMEGLQTGIYLVGGRSNIGKSSFCLQLGVNLAVFNKGKVLVLYFSIDDNRIKVIPRLLANFSNIEINILSNPVNRILQNTNLTEEQRELLEMKRDEAVHELRQLSASFVIKDVGEGRSLEYMEKMIKIYKAIAKNRQLVVFIDNLHKMTTTVDKKQVREKFTYISEGLKRISNVYDIPLVATVEIRKTQDLLAWPTEEDIKETVDLAYDADAVFMLHNEYTILQDNAKTKMFHVTDEGLVLPVVGLWARKNKTSDFKGRVYYKFHPSIAKVEEALPEERQYYENSRRDKLYKK